MYPACSSSTKGMKVVHVVSHVYLCQNDLKISCELKECILSCVSLPFVLFDHIYKEGNNFYSDYQFISLLVGLETIKLHRKWGASSMKQHAGACSSMQQQRQQHQAALGSITRQAACSSRGSSTTQHQAAALGISTRQQHQAGAPGRHQAGRSTRQAPSWQILRLAGTWPGGQAPTGRQIWVEPFRQNLH